VIEGRVSDDGVPVIRIPVAGQNWLAVIDTGFNGYLELPERLRPFVRPQFIGILESVLAAGKVVAEENFEVDFPFDGQTLTVEATFAPGDEILVGTGLLRRYRLEINFPERHVKLERSE
jgi:predicted aspartyl protease